MARALALGIAYARFALENMALFGLMFQLPTGALPEGLPRPSGIVDPAVQERMGRCFLATVRSGAEEGGLRPASAEHHARVSWGLVHGLVSLYLGGRLGDCAGHPGDFTRLLGQAIGPW